MQLGYVALLDTDSPQTFIDTHALGCIKRASATSAICERHTPPRSWGGVRRVPPLLTSTTMCLSAHFFTATAQLRHSPYGHTLSQQKRCNSTCFSNATAGCGLMTAPTVRFPPARAITVFGESLCYRSQDRMLPPRLFLTLRPTIKTSTCSTQVFPASRFLAIIDSSRSI